MTESTTAPTTSTSLPAAAADKQVAFDANITVEDLEPGWEECCRPFFMEPEQLSYNTCDDPAIPSNTAGFVREFSYMVDERGVEQGHLVAQVYVSATEDDAVSRLGCVGDDTYRAAAIEAAEERSLSKSLVEIGPMSTTYELQELAVGDHTTVDRMRVTYEVTHLGRTAWEHQDSIRMRIGRVTYRILVSTYADPLTTQELEDWASLFADRAPVG